MTEMLVIKVMGWGLMCVSNKRGHMVREIMGGWDCVDEVIIKRREPD